MQRRGELVVELPEGAGAANRSQRRELIVSVDLRQRLGDQRLEKEALVDDAETTTDMARGARQVERGRHRDGAFDICCHALAILAEQLAEDVRAERHAHEPDRGVGEFAREPFDDEPRIGRFTRMVTAR